MRETNDRPILAITMGDPAGVGSEIAVRALSDPETYRICRPLVVGDESVMKAAAEGTRISLELHPIADVSEGRFEPGWIDLLDLNNVQMKRLKKAQVSAMAGKAAYEYIIKA